MTSPDDTDLRTRAEARVKAKEDFRIHLIVYVMINALLWLIWYTSGADTGVPWPLFATLGWGAGLAAHWWTVFGRSPERREAEIQEEMRRLRGG